MPDVQLDRAQFGNIPADGLMKGFLLTGQPAKATPDGVLISTRNSKPGSWLQFRQIAEGGFDPDAFTAKFKEIDPRIDPTKNFALKGRAEAKEAVRRWLEKRDFGQLTYKTLETNSADERYLYLRETVLPVFFEMFPHGRLFCITYDDRANHYLAFLNTLKKMQVLNSCDHGKLHTLAGRTPMSSFGLNVPAEMLWLMLSFPSVLFFPEAFAFVASCEHRFFLVFVPGEPVNVSQGEEGYAPIERLMPRLLSVLDTKDGGSALFLHDKFVRATRRHPFSRRNYDVNAIASFFEAYVANLDRLVEWMCEATNFVAGNGKFDLDFALQSYLTVYLLLHTTYRIGIEQSDMFSRKMGLFDVLELYAGLIDCTASGVQAGAWRAHLEPPFLAQVAATMRRYPPPFDNDFEAALQQLTLDNGRAIERGLIYGRNTDGSVHVPNQGDIQFDEYIVRLMRALRNTKHGFAIRDEDYLAIHTGDLSNDFPDYVFALWLNFVGDRSSYTLRH